MLLLTDIRTFCSPGLCLVLINHSPAIKMIIILLIIILQKNARHSKFDQQNLFVFWIKKCLFIRTCSKSTCTFNLGFYRHVVVLSVENSGPTVSRESVRWIMQDWIAVVRRSHGVDWTKLVEIMMISCWESSMEMSLSRILS